MKLCGFKILAALAWLLAIPAVHAQGEDLKQQQIDLLKRRLAAAQTELRDERTARLVYETQIAVAGEHEFAVGDPLAYAPLTREVIEHIFTDSIEKQYPGRAFGLYARIYKIFGAIPDDMDIMKFMKDLMSEQAGGLYDPFTKKLYISPAFDVSGTLGRMILAHEICHAQQDETFDLQSLDVWEEGNDDKSTALMAIIEGDATLMMSEMQARSGLSWGMLKDLPKMAMIDQRKLTEAPAALRDSMLFPYMQGAAFFQELGGRTRLRPQDRSRAFDPSWRNEVFRHPPVSTEQILHPEKYLENERPAEIEKFDAEMKNHAHAFQSVMGEFGIRLLLAPNVGAERANAAAAGWNGDRLMIAENEAADEWNMIWVSQWDTQDDARQFDKAVREALAEQFDMNGLRDLTNINVRLSNSHSIGVQREGTKVTINARIKGASADQ